MLTRKKRILMLSVVLLIIIAISSVAYSWVYNNTDILKTNQDLFYEHISKNADIVNIIDKQWQAKYKEKIKNSKYDNKGEITFSATITDNRATELNTLISNTKIEFSGTTDISNKKAYQNVKLFYSNGQQELFNFNLLQNDTIYGAKSDEVVVKYVSIDTSSMHQLLNKLGIYNEKNIANEIEIYDFEQLLNMSDKEKKSRFKKYKDVLYKYIPKNKVTKEKKVKISRYGQEYEANKYTLRLTGDEEINVKVKLLETLLEDEKTINEINKIEQKSEANIKVLKTQIQEKIDEIKRKPENSNITLEISVYEQGGELLKTEIKAEGYSATIENINKKNKQETTIIINEGDTAKTYNLERKTFTNASEIDLEYIVTENEEQKSNIKATIKNQLISQNEIETTITMNLNNKFGEQKLNYRNNKNFNSTSEIENIKDNTVTLNEMTLDYNRSTLEAIKERLISIYKDRVKSVGLNPDRIKADWQIAIREAKDTFNKEEFEKQVQKALNYIKQDELVDEEYKKELESRITYEDKKRLKERRLVKRLNEFGLVAVIDEKTHKILIDSGANHNYAYIIDYDEYKVSQDE